MAWTTGNCLLQRRLLLTLRSNEDWLSVLQSITLLLRAAGACATCSSSKHSVFEWVSYFSGNHLKQEKSRFTSLFLRSLWRSPERRFRHILRIMSALPWSERLSNGFQSPVSTFKLDTVFTRPFHPKCILYFFSSIASLVLCMKKVGIGSINKPEARKIFYNTLGAALVLRSWALCEFDVPSIRFFRRRSNISF